MHAVRLEVLRESSQDRVYCDHLDVTSLQPSDNGRDIIASLGGDPLAPVIAAWLQEHELRSGGHVRCKTCQHSPRGIAVDAGIDDAHVVALGLEHRLEL